MNNLSNVNLNFLVALDALLRNKSVSRAAKELNLAQPTLSNTLRQLREIFCDELLIKRSGHDMLLTHKGKMLISPVSAALKNIDNVFSTDDKFNPELDNLTFNIGMPDHVTSVYMPQIITKIRNNENLKINLIHINNLLSYEEFKANCIDLAFGNFSLNSDFINNEKLITTQLVCLCSTKNPLSENKKLTVKDILSTPHIRVKYRDDFWDDLDIRLYNLYDEKIKTAITIQNICAAISIMERTKYLLITLAPVANYFSDTFDYRIFDLPLMCKSINYNMYWEKANDNNQANLWLRGLFKKYLKE
ncbi:MAG TPA: LysR family transcriptional regulator [Victivallales bacterium]|nr:LysR family transcriptional regulator [Victivallales bacterium]